MEDLQEWARKNPMWTAIGAVVVGTVLYRAFKKPDARALSPATRWESYQTGTPTWRSTMFPI